LPVLKIVKIIIRLIELSATVRRGGYAANTGSEGKRGLPGHRADPAIDDRRGVKLSRPLRQIHRRFPGIF